MSETAIQQINHIYGERIVWTLRLLTDGQPTDLTGCAVAFRGTLDERTAFEKVFTVSDPSVISFTVVELLDEEKSRTLYGRFYFTFPGGGVRASSRLKIVMTR